jgi:hypothetical protein
MRAHRVNDARTYLVLREREDGSGLWAVVGEETVSANHRLTDETDVASLVIRCHMNNSRSTGGSFAVVPKDVWRRVNAKRPEPIVERVT